MYKHLFGPVPSRRLGMSLGIDLIPHKICSLNCVYCECGATTTLTDERKEYVPVEEVYRELTDFFLHNPDPDYLTFSGAGEPTLHKHIGEVIAFVRELRPGIPVSVLTNGTLLGDAEVRKELMQADLVLPSLDAATDLALRRINRPPRSLQAADYINGLVQFSQEFKGEIWLEILILPGYNDGEQNLEALKEAILKIKPHRVQLNTLDRPGTVVGLLPAPMAQLKEIAGFFGMEQVEIIAPPEERSQVKSYRTDVESVILETIARRPCTLSDLEQILGLHINEINKYLGVLEEAGKVESLKQERGTFYQLRAQ
ncbi:MAG: radical SAM protein [Bacteroidales bacterium]|nr:radical SAM protein [Bacteroidales bacterium]